MADEASADDLKASLKAYKDQLHQIQQAISIATDDQKEELQKLSNDLQELIQLTQSSLPFGDSEDVNSSEDQLQNELQKLEGQKCQVPFKYAWGGLGYHNAIILDTHFDDEGDVSVEVVFMHPTMKKMQPCPYFLEGSCKYATDKCHYSHGYIVKLDAVRDYKEPDYSTITEKRAVLAKYKDDLWYRAKVTVQENGDEFLVKFDHCDEILLLNLHSLYPLDESETESSDSELENETTPTNIGEGSGGLLLMGNQNENFGEWEQHTRGFGSKLMQKMGYVFGEGLGRDGEGRIDPVKAFVFPPGRSLDWCMELREKAGDGDILSVERKLDREKKKEQHRQIELKKNTEKNSSVFDFINLKLAAKSTKQLVPESSVSYSRQKKEDLKKLSGEKLSVQSVKLGESIRQVERELADLARSLQRQSGRGDTTTASQIRSRMADRQAELDRLRASEKSITDEQKQRKSSSKLTIF